MTVTQILTAGLWSFGASACCAVYFNAGKKDIVPGAVLGAVGWMIYIAFKAGGRAESLGYFTGAFAVASFAEFLAVMLKHPATVYLVPGIIPLVPGGGIFLMMRAVVRGDFPGSLSAGYGALSAAVAIALGVAVASSVARIVTLAVRNSRKGRMKKVEHTVFFPEDFDY